MCEGDRKELQCWGINCVLSLLSNIIVNFLPPQPYALNYKYHLPTQEKKNKQMAITFSHATATMANKGKKRMKLRKFLLY